MTAQITADKGLGPVVGSMRLTAAEVGTPVTFANFDNTGVAGWKWEVIDAPALSPTLNPLPAAVFTPQTIIANDVEGHSVLVRLTTYTDAARTIVDDIDQVVLDVRFAPPFDWVIPAAGQSLEVDTIRGWASDVNRILREVNGFMASGGGGGGSNAWKDSVRFVATGDMPTPIVGQGTRVGDVITADANGAMGDIDGVTPQVGDAVFWYDRFFTPEDNGIYIIDDLGSVGSPWVITRREDMDEDTELPTQLAFMVEEGFRYARTMVTLESTQPLVINTDPLVFGFNGLGALQRYSISVAPGGTFDVQPFAMHVWSGLGVTDATGNLPADPPPRCRVGFMCNSQSTAGLVIDENGTGNFIDGPDGTGQTSIRVRGRGSVVELEYDQDLARWIVMSGHMYVLWGAGGDGNQILMSGATPLIHPTAVNVSEDNIVGRLTGDNVRGLSVAEVQTLLGIGGGVPASLFDANTILKADADDTPVALTINQGQIVGNALGTIGAISIAANRVLYANNAGDLGTLFFTVQSLILRQSSGSIINQVVGDSEFVGRAPGGDLGVITEAQAKAILGGVAGDDFATRDFVAATVGGIQWQESVLDKDLTAPPGGESTGDRYLVASPATGAWTGQEDNIAEWNGASYDFTAPTEGFALTVEDENLTYIYTGATWTFFANYTGAVVASLFDANTILKADTDDTPVALSVPEQTLVGRITGNPIAALTPAQIRTLINVEDGATAGDADAIHDNVAAEISAITAKASTVGADYVIIEDSEAADAKKSTTVQGLMDAILTAGGDVLVDGGGNVITI